ncbi:hypothetical protein [Limnoraphis robusta]|uniref:Uncharacterized protein n=1 Tax=Limnoraphis robusta CCNP1315 TaxID=3110306 RepID=A0ABU5TSK6_9CYAN|nr:hypothetical protein [Limnoraphis robusta]MEA5517885.1 hypothetical protein [Limnoraphis robusta CCNP1315]
MISRLTFNDGFSVFLKSQGIYPDGFIDARRGKMQQPQSLQPDFFSVNSPLMYSGSNDNII